MTLLAYGTGTRAVVAGEIQFQGQNLLEQRNARDEFAAAGCHDLSRPFDHLNPVFKVENK